MFKIIFMKIFLMKRINASDTMVSGVKSRICYCIHRRARSLAL